MKLGHVFRPLTKPATAATLLLAVSLSMSAAADAQEYLTEAKAHAAAVDILLGNPYGNSVTEVSRNLRRASLIVSGSSACGGVLTAPVWSFHVKVDPVRHGDQVIEGTLDIDAVTGELVCAGLPFLS